MKDADLQIIALLSQIQGAPALPVSLCGSSSDQSVPNSAWTKLTIWSRTATDAYDPQTMYASGNWTVPQAGIYQITARWNQDSNGASTVVEIYVNGSSRMRATNVSGAQASSSIGIIKLAASDVIAVYVFQNSGGALNLYGGDNSAKASVVFLPNS